MKRNSSTVLKYYLKNFTLMYQSKSGVEGELEQK